MHQVHYTRRLRMQVAQVGVQVDVFGLPRARQIARHHDVADGGNAGQARQRPMARFAQPKGAIHARAIKIQLQRISTLPIQPGRQQWLSIAGVGEAAQRAHWRARSGWRPCRRARH